MAQEDEQHFRPKVGRPRAPAGRIRPYTQQVMRAVYRAGGNVRSIGRAESSPSTGRFNSRGRGGRLARSFPADHGWTTQAASGTRLRTRRVIVKARVVKLRGAGSQASQAHLRYLERDGVTREGEPGRLYSA